jgi:pimeloyl-ACP methyl ester carboxylesterase
MGWQEDHLPAPHDHVAVRRLGDVDDGATPIVLLHGFSDSGECWMALVPFLASRGVVALPDARGHGSSGVPNEPVTVDSLAGDAAAVIESLGRPAVVIGHSMGADTAARLAQVRPELVAALVLEDPPWRATEPAASPQLADRFVREWVASLQAATEAQLVERGRSENPRWPEEELAPWARAKLQLSPTFLEQAQHWRFRAWLDGLPEVRCPALLLTGDNDLGAIVTPEVATAAAARQPRLRHVHVAGAGHCIRRDQGSTYVQVVTAFLDELA